MNEQALGRKLDRFGAAAVDNIINAAEARANYGADAAAVANEYVEMADGMRHIANLEAVFEDAAVATEVNAARGSDFEIHWLWSNRSNVSAVAVQRGTRKGADVVLKDGSVVELKKFLLSSAFYSESPALTAQGIAARLGEGCSKATGASHSPSRPTPVRCLRRSRQL